MFVKKREIEQLIEMVEVGVEVINHSDDVAKRCYHQGRIDVAIFSLKILGVEIEDLFKRVVELELVWEVPTDIASK